MKSLRKPTSGPHVGLTLRARSLAASLAIAAILLIALSAASASGARSQSGASSRTIPLLRIGFSAADHNLDPRSAGDAGYVDALGLETLTRVRPDGEIQPWLAASVTQPTPATYVYHLRHRVKFWDGTEMTSADVANALNYYHYPPTLNPFTTVKSVKALDRYTVRVTLRHPDAGWPYVAAANTQVFEKKFQEEHRTTFGQPGTLIMGTGPWAVTSLDPTSGAELSANSHWWGGKVNILHISLRWFADENSEALAFRAGDIDVVPRISGPQAFAAASGSQLLSAPGCQMGLFSMPTQTGPWSDVHVRRAIAYALKRSDLIAAGGGYATPDYTLVPRVQLRTIASTAQMNKLQSSLNLYSTNLAKAKAELAKSAYPNGFSANLVESASVSIQNVAQVAANEVAPLGIKLTVTNPGGFFAKITGPADQRPPYIIQGFCNSPDPGFYPHEFLGEKNTSPGLFNTANYAPSDIESLLTGAVATTSPAKRLGLYSKLLKRLSSDVPYIPLWVADGTAAISSKFSWPTYRDSAYYDSDWALELKPA